MFVNKLIINPKNNTKNIFMFVMQNEINHVSKSSQAIKTSLGRRTVESAVLFVGNNFVLQRPTSFYLSKMQNEKNSITNENNSTIGVGAALPNKAKSNSVYKQKYEQTKLLTELFMVYIEDYATNFIFSEEKAKELTALYFQSQIGIDIS